jgi:hypothetical protein
VLAGALVLAPLVPLVPLVVLVTDVPDVPDEGTVLVLLPGVVALPHPAARTVATASGSA